MKTLLWLRYRVRVSGVAEVAQRGRGGILFLPNHPAIIDPLIVTTYLNHPFRPRPLADADQMQHPVVGWFADQVGVRRIESLQNRGAGARDQVQAVVEACAEDLRSGKNVLLYPSGHLYRSALEDLRGNSAVQRLLEKAPQTRVVLVRTRGLWGSSFSFATGKAPNLLRNALGHIPTLLKNFIFFSPRRVVTIELNEPADLPRNGDRNALNRFIERYYNEDAPPNTYVPHTIWESGGVRQLPEPTLARAAGDPSEVPEATRKLVIEFIAKQAGVAPAELQFKSRLAQDLNLDSLARAELLVWLGEEFGFHTADVATLQTVGDAVLAARGEASDARPVDIMKVPPIWFRALQRGDGAVEVTVPPGETLTEVFLRQAAISPGDAVIADQLAGVKTYREIITGICALRPLIQSLAGERVGLMLPASAGSAITYLAMLFAEKTPVLLNWTTGARNMGHALDLTGSKHVLTVKPLVQRIEQQGVDLSAIRDRFVYLEDLRAKLGTLAKLSAVWQARFDWSALRRAKPQKHAAILLTSGSEALPKAVPLSHANLLANLRDVPSFVRLRRDDALMGFLPPFHSFGLTVTSLLPLVTGLRVVFHANPTEGWVIARLIEAYKASAVAGTPTFLAGIARSAQAGQLNSLRLAVTGAEKCPEKTYELLRAKCPNAKVLEGYGITECSPVVCANREADPVPGSIGHLLPSLSGVLIDVDTGRTLGDDEVGMFLVRGPSVFEGYLGDAPSPFVEHDGHSWYKTGDLVRRDRKGVHYFAGRLKRFVKLGGEMISLPAIESVLLAQYASDDDKGPVLAVEATPSEDHPEIVLFATREIDRATANRLIREASLSALHNITRVERVETIPVLGTGKTDYRALKELLRASNHPK